MCYVIFCASQEAPEDSFSPGKLAESFLNFKFIEILFGSLYCFNIVLMNERIKIKQSSYSFITL